MGGILSSLKLSTP